MKTVLTIAGSDPSGGAGIQADIKTITALGTYATSVITAITVQNTMGVTDVFELPYELVQKQIDAIALDIRPDAVKIGMVSSEPLIRGIAESLRKHRLQNIVVDPVMIATSGASLFQKQAIKALIELLLPLATLLTPNMSEASELTKCTITNKTEMAEAASEIHKTTGAAVLVKGGHLTQCADDFLITSDRSSWYRASRIDTKNTHGTGCTLSSAIAVYLAKGYPLYEAVQEAKNYVRDALSTGLDLGKGSGPLNHFARHIE